MECSSTRDQTSATTNRKTNEDAKRMPQQQLASTAQKDSRPEGKSSYHGDSHVNGKGKVTVIGKAPVAATPTSTEFRISVVERVLLSKHRVDSRARPKAKQGLCSRCTVPISTLRVFLLKFYSHPEAVIMSPARHMGAADMSATVTSSPTMKGPA